MAEKEGALLSLLLPLMGTPKFLPHQNLIRTQNPTPNTIVFRVKTPTCDHGQGVVAGSITLPNKSFQHLVPQNSYY